MVGDGYIGGAAGRLHGFPRCVCIQSIDCWGQHYVQCAGQSAFCSCRHYLNYFHAWSALEPQKAARDCSGCCFSVRIPSASNRSRNIFKYPWLISLGYQRRVRDIHPGFLFTVCLEDASSGARACSRAGSFKPELLAEMKLSGVCQHSKPVAFLGLAHKTLDLWCDMFCPLLSGWWFYYDLVYLDNQNCNSYKKPESSAFCG